MTARQAVNVGRGGGRRKWTAANSGEQRRMSTEVDYGQRKQCVGDVVVVWMMAVGRGCQ